MLGCFIRQKDKKGKKRKKEKPSPCTEVTPARERQKRKEVRKKKRGVKETARAHTSNLQHLYSKTHMSLQLLVEH